MYKAILFVTGVLNLLFGFFHIYLGYAIYRSTALSEAARGLMEALNVGGTLMIFFLAYACLMHRREMLGEGLGRAVLLLAAAVYLSRAAEEFFWFQFSPVIFAACLVVGLLHLILLLRPMRAPEGVAPQAHS